MASRAPVTQLAGERFLIPGLDVPLRAVPERRARSWQRRGIELIINREHRDMVLQVIAGRKGE